jgi:hypothetical protein
MAGEIKKDIPPMQMLRGRVRGEPLLFCDMTQPANSLYEFLNKFITG